MSLLSNVFNDEFHPACNRPSCYRSPFDLWLRPTNSLGGYLRPFFADLSKMEKEEKIGKDGFQVCLDIQHFQPNEISVKTENRSIIVHAKHEEKRDEHGFISREFTRRYDLPEGFKPEDVTSSISSDGILTIKAPHSTPADEGKGKVRHIHIQQTGPAQLNVTSNGKKTEEQKTEEQKTEEQKTEEQNTEEQKPEEQKPEEQKPEEQKTDEQKTDEQKPDEESSGKEANEQKPNENKDDEQN